MRVRLHHVTLVDHMIPCHDVLATFNNELGPVKTNSGKASRVSGIFVLTGPIYSMV